jgi:hypothetical protein
MATYGLSRGMALGNILCLGPPFRRAVHPQDAAAPRRVTRVKGHKTANADN